MEAPVEVADRQLRIALLAGLHQRDGRLHIAAFPHDPVVEHELMLIFYHRQGHPQLNRSPRLAFADPTGVFLKHGKNLLRGRNGLSLQHPTLDLVFQTGSQRHQAVAFGQVHRGPGQLIHGRGNPLP